MLVPTVRHTQNGKGVAAAAERLGSGWGRGFSRIRNKPQRNLMEGMPESGLSQDDH
jgi:hypothetical protein